MCAGEASRLQAAEAIACRGRAATRHDPDQPLLREGAVGAGAGGNPISRGAPRSGHPSRRGAPRGRGATVPVLVTPEGALGESEAILAWVDERTPPEQRLFPADPAERSRSRGSAGASTSGSGRRGDG